MSASTTAVTAFLTALVLSWVFRQARKPAPTLPDGTIVLTYGKWMMALGAVSGIVMPVALVIVALKAGFREPNDPYYFAAMIVFFGVLGWWFLLEGVKRRILVSETGAVSHSPWRGPTRIDWPEVAAVKFSALGSSLTLVSRSGRKVQASVMMPGVVQFADAIARHVPPPLAGEALGKLRAYLARRRTS